MTRHTHDGDHDAGRLLDLEAGRLPESEAADLRLHVDGCDACRRKLEAARLLHEGIEQMAAPALDSDSSADVWASVEHEARAAGRRTRHRRAWGTVLTSRPALAAAAVLLVAAAGAILVLTERGPDPVATGQVLQDEGTAQFECGASVELAEETEAVIAAASTHSGEIHLVRGSIEVHVDKRREGTFRVTTEDAIVTVTGTRFVVSRTDGQSTHVLVREGTVEVEPVGGGRAGETLETGESLIVPCARLYVATLRREGIDALEQGDVDEAVERLDAYLAALGDERDAEIEMKLADALIEKGEPESAVSIYRRIADADDSLRAENALAFLAILYDRMKDAESATAAWREYVRRFPEGVHKQDALRELEQNE